MADGRESHGREVPYIPPGASEDVSEDEHSREELERIRQRHGLKVEDFKNVAAVTVAALCLVAIVALALVDHFSPGGGDSLSSASETLKLVATTALGFLFGRESRG